MHVPTSTLIGSNGGVAAEPAMVRQRQPLLRWPDRPDGIAYGGDYNPEQWPEEVWAEDVALMRAAGVNLVSVGIFSWVLLEPHEGQYEFGWLDRVLDLLHDNGIAVDLGTPTVSPPAWFIRRYPASRPVTREGHVLGGAARGTFCPNSPEYRAAAAAITERLAERYADHPSLVMWHVHNEYGGHVPACYCDRCAAAFRVWLSRRHGDLEAVNTAWGTSFWGQRYGDWAEIEPPRVAPTSVNPGLQLDYMRFCSDAYLECFVAERDILHRRSPGVPVTTNFMAGNHKSMDYWRWAAEVDVVANNHYLRAEDPDNHIDLAMTADLSRSLAGGAPWLLMEHSTSAVNWQPRNLAKRPGEMTRNSLTHVARGADAVMFFQWRAARRGAEKFHSAMLGHAGTRSRVWREVVSLGHDLQSLSALRGTAVCADVAVVWDWQSWWALELEWRPSVDLGYRERIEAYYAQLWRDHFTVDFVPPERDLGQYRLVVVPSLYLTTTAAAARLADYVRAGGTVVVSYFSGIVDADDAIHPGGHPGALRELLGLEVEEWLPLRRGERVQLDNGACADVWSEDVALHGAEAVLTYVDGPVAGGPAVTRHSYGAGQAWYVSTRLSGTDLAELLSRAYADAGLQPLPGVPSDVELVRREGGGRSYLIAVNHAESDVTVEASGTELITGAVATGEVTVPAGGVRVVDTSAR
jgi:beta-galactosidase